MTIRKKIWGLGMVFVGVAVACTPEVRELGDEPLAGGNSGSGGSGNGKGGSKSVLPNGGRKSSTAGAAGTGLSFAGAPVQPDTCFSPTDHLELAGDPEAVGCACDGDELVCVTTTDGDVPWLGAFRCVEGRWKLELSGCDQYCFSPTNAPELALEPDIVGCACNDEPPECVRTMHDGRPWDVALYCIDGRWTSAEDGVCDWLAPGCQVDGVSYPSGARRVPDPFSCNECECQEGQLVNCTTADCAERICDDGSSRARRCLGCGPADGCTEYEIGCLSGEGCEDGLCSSPWCG